MNSLYDIPMAPSGARSQSAMILIMWDCLPPERVSISGTALVGRYDMKWKYIFMCLTNKQLETQVRNQHFSYSRVGAKAPSEATVLNK